MRKLACFALLCGAAISAFSQGGGPMITPALTSGKVATALNNSSITASYTDTGGVLYQNLATPTAPTLTKVGAHGGGATTYYYKVVAIGVSDAIHSAVSATSLSVTNCIATLDATNYVTVTWTAVTGANSYEVYRSNDNWVANTLLVQTGITALTVNDYAAGSAATAPSIGCAIAFEGSTANAFESKFVFTEPTADRTFTWRDASGTVLISGDTLTGDVTATFDTDGSSATTIAANSVALGTDTTGSYVASVATNAITGLSGGAAGSEDAALTLALDWTQTLAGNPQIANNGTVFGENGVLFEGATGGAANALETWLTVVDPTVDRTITLPDISGTVITTGDTGTVTGTMVLDNTVALGTDTSGNYVDNATDATLTLTGTEPATLGINLANANTWSAYQWNSTAGAASTPAIYLTGAPSTAGTTTTDFPLFLMQPTAATASTTWSTDGTFLGVNADLAQGNLIDLQVDGASKFSVSSAGLVTTNGNIKTAGGVVSTPATSQVMTIMDSGMGAGLGSAAAVTMCTGSYAQTSGSVQAIKVSPTWNISNTPNPATSSCTDVLVNRTETSLPPGPQYLLDLQVGGASQWNVTNKGIQSAGVVADVALQCGTILMADAGTDKRFDVNGAGGVLPIGVLAGTGPSAQGTMQGVVFNGLGRVLMAEDLVVARGEVVFQSAGTAGRADRAAGLQAAGLNIGKSLTSEDVTATILFNGCTGGSGCINTALNTPNTGPAGQITLNVDVAALGWAVGEPVVYYNSGGTTPTGLTDGNVYWLISVSTTNVTMAATRGGAVVVPSTQGDDVTQYLQRLPFCVITLM